jgi:hypothetical protein
MLWRYGTIVINFPKEGSYLLMSRYLALELFQFIGHASSALRPEENNFEYWKNTIYFILA